MTSLSSRRALLVAALGFSRVRWSAPPPRPAAALLAWLETWTAVGAIATGMARQGHDLSLTRYAAEGWRATFYISGREHSATDATGSAFAPTPFVAVRDAAWETLAHTP